MIRTENLVYRYTDDKKVIDDVSIDIRPGEFISIVGHNGSGKSTFAKHLNALLKPSEGTVWVDGNNTADGENELSIRQYTGMVFQNPDNQIVSNVVEEDVAFGPENIGIPTADIWKRVESALAAVGMTVHKNESPNQLSGGQKQRVAIAGVLAMKPNCIVLDESTSMLDPKGRKEIIEVVTKLNKEEHISIILITHNMEETVHSDKIYVMSEGKIVMKGTPKQIFGQVAELRKYKLEPPVMTYIADMLRKKGMDIPLGVLTMDELVSALQKEFKGGAADVN